MARLGDKEMSLGEKQSMLKSQAVIHAESLYHYQLIARATGITDDTLKKYRDEDDEFSVRLEQARSQFIQKKMKVARPEFLLERLESDIFKERKEVDNNLSGGVTLSADQAEQLIRARADRSNP